MSGRGRQGAAPVVSVRQVAAGVAGLLGASLGVLGWLLAQAATFGVAEHTHLTVHGVTSHRHDYAAPLAAGAGAMALLAVLVLVLVHLTATPRSSSSAAPSPHAAPRVSGRPALRAGRLAPSVAALLFVTVEAVEFVGSGAPAAAVAGVLAIGAGLQWLVARVACALTGAVVRSIERVTVLPARAACPPAPPRPAALLFAADIGAGARARAWDGRAPPVRMPVLVPFP